MVNGFSVPEIAAKWQQKENFIKKNQINLSSFSVATLRSLIKQDSINKELTTKPFKVLQSVNKKKGERSFQC